MRSYGNEGITGGLKEAMKVGENALKGITGSETFKKTGKLLSENARKALETARKARESAKRVGGSAAATMAEKLRELRDKDEK